MSDWPKQGNRPLFISSWSALSAASEFRAFLTLSQAAQTWVANQVVYVPIFLPFPYRVFRMWWINGSTITTSNANVGLFLGNGKRLYASGSTALSGATAPQFVTLGTPLQLRPGRYYMAYTCDNTTARVTGAAPTVIQQQMAGVLQQASNFALADPATFATPTLLAYPFFGITRTASGF